MKRAAIFLLCAAWTAHAQSTDAKIAFEVASIRKSNQADLPGRWGVRYAMWMRGGPGTSNPEKISFTNSSLKSILTDAFGVKRYQISGPAWLETTGFTIAAKVRPGASKEEVRLMLQNLLAERFNLVFHRETRETPVYALVVANGGPRMKLSPDDPDGGGGEFGPWHGNARRTATNETMKSLAFDMSPWLDRPVIDMTGLTAKYDFTLYWAPEYPMVEVVKPTEPADASEPAPRIFTAVQDQLGLKLDPRKVPMEFIVIDRIEKTPSEN